MSGPIDDTELIYVGDPMCSWCWGFAPVVEELAGPRGFPVSVVVGGLRPGPAAEPLGPRFAEYLRREWRTIADRTGQPFSVDVIDTLGAGWLYDTELPAAAVVRMRSILPARTLDLFTRIQRAFYAEGIDVTDPDRYPELLAGFDVDTDEYVAALRSSHHRSEAWEDFARARRWGITGFPTLLVRTGERLQLVTAGYRPLEEIVPSLPADL